LNCNDGCYGFSFSRAHGSQNASKFAGAAAAKIVQRLIGQAIKPPFLGVALDLLIEARGVELLEPGAKLRELIRRQLGDSFSISSMVGRNDDICHGRACPGHPRLLERRPSKRRGCPAQGRA